MAQRLSSERVNADADADNAARGNATDATSSPEPDDAKEEISLRDTLAVERK